MKKKYDFFSLHSKSHANTAASMTAFDAVSDVNAFKQLVKYAVIILSSAPMIVVYPFIMKYFESGVMIGAVKG